MATPKPTDILGRDLKALYRLTDGRHEDVDFDRVLSVRTGVINNDLASTQGVDNTVQAVIHRIKTKRGELAGHEPQVSPLGGSTTISLQAASLASGKLRIRAARVFYREVG